MNGRICKVGVCVKMECVIKWHVPKMGVSIMGVCHKIEVFVKNGRVRKNGRVHKVGVSQNGHDHKRGVFEWACPQKGLFVKVGVSINGRAP